MDWMLASPAARFCCRWNFESVSAACCWLDLCPVRCASSSNCSAVNARYEGVENVAHAGAFC